MYSKYISFIFFFFFCCVAGISCSTGIEDYGDIRTIRDNQEGKEINKGFLTGKTFSILGNSISTYAGCIPDGFRNYYTSNHFTLNDTWWMQFANYTGATLFSNASWSGSTVAYSGKDHPNSYFYSDTRIDSIGSKGEPDYIVVIGGTNDWGLQPCDLGRYPSEDTLTFIGAYTTMLKKIKYKYSNSLIICSTILPRSQGTEVRNQKGWTISMANNYIKRIVEDYNCLFVDMNNCGIDNPSNKYMFDSVHPNALGMRLIAESFVVYFNGILND